MPGQEQHHDHQVCPPYDEWRHPTAKRQRGCPRAGSCHPDHALPASGHASLVRTLVVGFVLTRDHPVTADRDGSVSTVRRPRRGTLNLGSAGSNHDMDVGASAPAL